MHPRPAPLGESKVRAKKIEQLLLNAPPHKKYPFESHEHVHHRGGLAEERYPRLGEEVYSPLAKARPVAC